LKENRHLVRDVVIQTTVHDLWVSDETFSEEPPVVDRIDLGNDLWIGQLESGTVNAVFDACTPPGLNFNPTRLFGHHYCVVRELANPRVPPVKWDEDQKLRDCIALSRLVHPTTISTHFSARLFYEYGALSMIVPGLTHGLGSHAFVNGPTWRNWLTEKDAHELKGLIAAYDLERLPSRLRRAMRHLQYACLTHESEVRFTLVVSGLEALVNTRDHGVSAQFKKRVVLAARDVQTNISEDTARQVYNFRSCLSHGQRVRGEDIQKQFAANYAAMETLLRRLIRRGIEDNSFSARFESAASIEKAYPI
jgi:hypothetical protein